LIFRGFEASIPNVVLARKGGIDASKPIKHSCFIENLCRFSLYSAQDPSLTLEDEGTSAANASIRRGLIIRSNQAIKSFLVLFLEKEQSKSTNFSYQDPLAAFL